MRIISDFKDYYDFLQQYDEDRETVYLRKPKELPLDFDRCPYGVTIIHFCGKAFPCMEMFDWHHLRRPPHNRPFYTFDVEAIQQKRSRYLSYLRPFSEVVADAVRSVSSEAPVWLMQSVAVDHSPRLVENPRLSAFNFARIVPPHEAYQELVQWFGRIAEPRKPIPHIDDKTMAEAKGFDKWSFRKEPQSK